MNGRKYPNYSVGTIQKKDGLKLLALVSIYGVGEEYLSLDLA